RCDLLLRPRPAGFHCRCDAAARTKLPMHYSPDRVASLHHILQHLIHYIFLEDAEISVAEQIFLNRFELQAPLTRHVTNIENAKIRQTSLWADRSQLGIVNRNL